MRLNTPDLGLGGTRDVGNTAKNPGKIISKAQLSPLQVQTEFDDALGQNNDIDGAYKTLIEKAYPYTLIKEGLNLNKEEGKRFSNQKYNEIVGKIAKNRSNGIILEGKETDEFVVIIERMIRGTKVWKSIAYRKHNESIFLSTFFELVRNLPEITI